MTRRFALVARTAPFALALAASACAGRATTGDLVPRRDRVTNERLAADLAAIDRWGARLAAVAARNGGTTGPHAYTVAKARAWLTFAREEYVAEPRDSTSDAALAQARALIGALERDSVPASADATALVVGTSRVRDDLWSLAAELKTRTRYALVADAVAAAEVELVRAGRSAAAQGRILCESGRHLARAERLLHEADARSQEVVVERPVARDSVEPPRPAEAPPPPRPVAVEVHFALARASIGPRSARILDEVARFLEKHRSITVALEGHADPRGDPGYNVALSRRRARAVRAALAARGIDPARVIYDGVGGARRAAAGTSARDFAVDRRVVMHFLSSDGTALTGATFPDDVQIERARSGRKTRAERSAARRE